MNLIYIVCVAVTLLACFLGRICGMGGGVIIKPVLDSLGIMDVASINFLSGCTVLTMSAYSIINKLVKKQKLEGGVQAIFMGIGAAIGGILGKNAFAFAAKAFGSANQAGGVQAIVLFICVLGTYVYTCKKDSIKSYHVTNPLACIIIGLLLGGFSSFLGIGGGPFNMAVLFLFFSMEAKVAAVISLCVILISQATSLGITLIEGNVPGFSIGILIAMAVSGIAGSFIGEKINNRMDNAKVTKLFKVTMGIIMIVCVYNAYRFLLA